MKLAQINAAWIESLKAQKMEEGLSKKSVNNLTVLRKLLALAQEFGELEAVPRVEWLKVPKPEIDFLSFEEAEQMESRTKPSRWKMVIILALNTGLRIGELTALSWDCVDMANGCLVVKRNVYRGQLDTPKGGREREVPLNDRALRALREYPRRLNSPLMGHATIEMTMRYAHLSPEVKKDSVRALDMRPNSTLTPHRQEATPRN